MVHKSVVKLISYIASPEVAKEIEESLESRIIIRKLMVERALKGYSHEDIAARLNCEPARILEIENSTDDEIPFGELRRYAKALGFKFSLELDI